MTTTTNLAITHIDSQQSQKEVVANAAFDNFDAAICGSTTISVLDGTNTITAAQVRGAARLLLSAGSPAPTAAITVVLPAVKRLIAITNDCGYDADVECTGGALTVTVSDGSTALLYCDGAEVYSVASGGGSGAQALTINAQTGTSYTLALADAGALVTLNNAAAITLTVPENATVAFPVGTQILLAQLDAGQVTVSPASGSVTILSPATMKLRTAGAQAALVKIATNSWLLEGNLDAT